MDKSIFFYKELMGLHIVSSATEEGNFISEILGIDNCKIKTVKLSVNNSEPMVELIEFISPKCREKTEIVPNSAGPTHVAFRVDNIDKLYHKLKEYEILFLSEPRISTDKKAKVAFCRDPEGTLIEIVEILKG